MVQSKVTKLLALAALCTAVSAHAFTPSEANETESSWAVETRTSAGYGAAGSPFPASVSESAPAQLPYAVSGEARSEYAIAASPSMTAEPEQAVGD